MSEPYGMKVSKIGFDVLTTANKNLSFSSELATHSVYNIVDVTKTSPATSATINHALGYVPKTWIFRYQGSPPNDYLSRIPFLSVAGNGLDYYITDQDIIIETDDTATMVFKVIIFTRSPNP